ncbi:KEL3 [Candida pseudojiufengensis]|uniref:KEL3 n=1 Tax=Candida pseudojiufengensis TaxID=497109 RepID=UPI0022241384|nr:KEL3 [Candida pseudojiufengensis]KAI5962266.1 KEL3 [Candida pseudojiufengensis]
MAKKDKKSKEAKKLRAAEKQKKNENKAESKNKKLAKKLNDGEEEEDDDIDTILANYQKEQEEYNEIKVEILETHPSKRLNPTIISNPVHTKKELILFGGESVLEGSKTSHFYNDLYTYSIDNDTWRKITSKNSPLPRSSHAMCSHPSGIALLFGGEFSSPKQSTFYHYGDTWILDCDTKEWQKLEFKKSPSARSGHRLIVWKNFIILHGGFRDLGTFTTYLNDLWVFDVTDFKWYQVEFSPNHPIPDARSGHSFIPCNEGGVINGGYTKVKARKGLQKGKVLNDCWLLKMKSDIKNIKFERRKKQGQLPSPRVGCSLVYHKNRGILFGGVYDYEESEEQLDSEFYNQLYSYHIENNRWYNLTLRPLRNKKREVIKEKTRDEDLEDILNSILLKANLNDDEEDDKKDLEEIQKTKEQEEEDEDNSNKEMKEYPIMNQLPHPRFNATTCVVDDQLYIFGGIFERGEQEFNLYSFYSIDLGRLDGVKVFWEDLSELEKAIEDSEEEYSDDDEYDEENDKDDKDEEDEEDEEEEKEEAEEEEIAEEEEFPDPRPWLPHPKPFESLRSFYIRTGAQFLEWSISSHRDARGKYLKKIAFDLCEDRFWERREAVSVAEDNLEEMGGVGEVIEKDTSKFTKRR